MQAQQKPTSDQHISPPIAHPFQLTQEKTASSRASNKEPKKKGLSSLDYGSHEQIKVISSTAKHTGEPPMLDLKNLGRQESNSNRPGLQQVTSNTTQLSPIAKQKWAPLPTKALKSVENDYISHNQIQLPIVKKQLIVKADGASKNQQNHQSQVRKGHVSKKQVNLMSRNINIDSGGYNSAKLP